MKWRCQRSRRGVLAGGRSRRGYFVSNGDAAGTVRLQRQAEFLKPRAPFYDDDLIAIRGAHYGIVGRATCCDCSCQTEAESANRNSSGALRKECRFLLDLDFYTSCEIARPHIGFPQREGKTISFIEI